MRRSSWLPTLWFLALCVACGGEADDAQPAPQVEDSPPSAAVPETEITPPPTSAVDAVAPAVDSVPTETVEVPEEPPPQARRPDPVTASRDSIGVLRFLEELELEPSGEEWAARHPDWATTFHGENVLEEADQWNFPFARYVPWCMAAFSVDAPGAPDSVLARLRPTSDIRNFRDIAEQTGERVIRRTFYFYGGAAPAVPDDYALPPITAGLDYHRESCTLGLVTAEIFGEADEEASINGLVADYADVLGEPTAIRGAPVGWGESVAGGWTLEETQIGVGNSSFGHAVVFAYRPHMGTAFATNRRGDRGASRAFAREVFDIALQAAGIEGAAAEIIATYRGGGAPEDRDERRDDALTVVRALTDRPEGAVPRPSPLADTLAARLIVADRFLLDYLPYLPSSGGDPRGEEAAEAFIALGAGYYYSELDYTNAYRESLATAAAEVAGPGGWGDLAQIASFEDGCSWLRVLSPGVPMMDRQHPPRIRARYHFLMGEAYASLVHTQQRGRVRGEAYDDPEENRRLAVLHYEQAIAGELAEGQKDVAWRRAWAMAHNLTVYPRYYCMIP